MVFDVPSANLLISLNRAVMSTGRVHLK